MTKIVIHHRHRVKKLNVKRDCIRERTLDISSAGNKGISDVP